MPRALNVGPEVCAPPAARRLQDHKANTANNTPGEKSQKPNFFFPLPPQECEQVVNTLQSARFPS